MNSFKSSLPNPAVHHCRDCGLEWQGCADEEGCPLARLEGELFPFETVRMEGEDLPVRPVVLVN